MTPIFDRNCTHTGWYDEARAYVFDTRMQFIAFVHGRGLFSLRAKHLGFFMDGIFRDRQAGAVAFTPGHAVGATPPVPPVPPTPAVPPTLNTPSAPPTPPAPAAPPGAWSRMGWSALMAS
ncbi:4-fold beta flower protein [Undibacterium sp.]|uniref:4-fold beta flower protein n=1 Tax=Undibacterium sp. TaxID=1914977 RepID=UPI00374D2823